MEQHMQSGKRIVSGYVKQEGSFPSSRKFDKSLPGGLGRLNACPTNTTPGLVKVGQAIPPVRSLASEVVIPISKKSSDIGQACPSHIQHSTQQAHNKRGFTLIELMVVMGIITVIISIAVPMYQKSILRGKESVLRSNLFTMRQVIDEYTYDKQKAPPALEDLVKEGYLRQVPMDPITGQNSSWKIIMEDAAGSASTTEPGIFDVRSGSERQSLEGTPYSDW